MLFRHEQPQDADDVSAVNEQAFGRAAEGDLVEALRLAGKATLSMVAVDQGQLIGHILYSPVRLEHERGVFPVVGLAPMSVLPRFQRQGVGSALVKESLEACRQAGHEGVVVLGHPEYYPRFGFLPASRFGIESEFDVADEVFMALELRAGVFQGVLQGGRGLARYGPEFSSF